MAARPTIRLPESIATAANPQVIMKRARSASIVKVEEVGKTASEELDQTADLNSEWVNHKGAHARVSDCKVYSNI